MNIDRNQFLKESLPGLSVGDSTTQNDVYQQFFDELHHHAWDWLKHEEYGHDAATTALLAFFVRCQNGPFSDETNLVGYLYECVRNAVHKIWNRRFRFTDMKSITKIVPGNPVQVVVMDHGLTGRETFAISHSYTKPGLNGKYGGKSRPYSVVDRDTLEFPQEVQPGGFPGYLHVRRSRPKEGGFQSSVNGEDSPTWEPQDNRTPPAGDDRDAGIDPQHRTLEQLIETYGQSLTGKERLILMMRAQGHSYKEIGDEIGRSADTVAKTDIPKALKQLRKAMNRGNDMDGDCPNSTLGR